MLIGLTGGIGSGKSTIANALRALGYPVYDSDSEAKRILTHNPAVRSQIELLFGSDVYDGDMYQTKRVAQEVFRDPALLERLNKIVHPAVCFDVRHWAKAQAEESDGRICFVESAILFESGLAEECQLVAEITAPLELRIERTMNRDGITREQVEKRLSAQMTEAERLARANIIINNDGQTDVHELAQDIINKIKN